jgi:hypothetical protein
MIAGPAAHVPTLFQGLLTYAVAFLLKLINPARDAFSIKGQEAGPKKLVMSKVKG